MRQEARAPVRLTAGGATSIIRRGHKAVKPARAQGAPAERYLTAWRRCAYSLLLSATGAPKRHSIPHSPPERPPMLMDTHAHIQTRQFDKDRDAVIQAAFDAGVE